MFGVILPVLVSLCLSLVTAFIYESSDKNAAGHPGSFILRLLLCFGVLLIPDLIFVSSLSGTETFSGIFSGQFTPDDLCLFSLWFLSEVIVCAFFTACTHLVVSRKNRVAFRLFSKRQEHVFCALLFISLAFTGISVSVKSWSETKLLISGIRNTGGAVSSGESVDEANGSGDTGDMIIIYNPTSLNIKLSHFYVTDDLSEQPKQVSADDVIPAGGYFAVLTEEGDNGFSVGNGGDEVIYLLNSGENVIDSVAVPVLNKGTIYVRDDSEGGWGIYDPELLLENESRDASADETKYVPEPVFSVDSGFYNGSFTLKLSAPEGCRIYYSVDSTVPDENSILYENGIEISNVSENPNVYNSIQNLVTDWLEYIPPADPVDKAMIVRAVAIDGDDNKSDVVTKTYFIDLDQYRDRYVLSLVSDADDLFGDDGICVTGREYDEWYLGGKEGPEPEASFNKSGRDYEINTYIELFDDQLLMSQKAGLRIQGDAGRDRAGKGFKFYSRKSYSGSYYFDCDIFGEPIHSFAVRNGNAGHGFDDAFVESLVRDQDRGVGGKNAVWCTLFLNGEYWTSYYLTEIYSEDYIARKFDLDPEKITLTDVIPDEIYEFLEEHDLSDDEDYLLFCDLVDIRNYIDFMVDNIYLCNMDLSETKNLKIWRTDGDSGVGYDDGRWRFLVHDMDAIVWNNNDGTYGIESYGINSFSTEKRYAGAAFDKETLFPALMTNADFCRQFVLTFMDFANTYFEKSNVEKQLIEWEEDLTWNYSFFDRRFDYIVPYLAEEFDLTGTLETITLKADPNGGTVMINTVTPDLSDGEWSGYYYTDYPVTVSAEPAEGYEFAGWQHGDEFYTDPVIEIELTEDNNVWEAVFVLK